MKTTSSFEKEEEAISLLPSSVVTAASATASSSSSSAIITYAKESSSSSSSSLPAATAATLRGRCGWSSSRLLWITVMFVLSLLLNVWQAYYTSFVSTTTTKAATAAATTTTTSLLLNKTKSDVIYFHVHMAKTGGTNLNGLLAAEFEHVCGHKGSSYDYYQFNQREIQIGRHYVNFAGGTDDTISIAMMNKTKRNNWNRGRVPIDIMTEIGFEDCDYISLENPASVWLDIIPSSFKLELHVPCRDPIDHLLSSCNYKKTNFNCDVLLLHHHTNNNNNNTDGSAVAATLSKQRANAIWNEIQKCLLSTNRFSNEFILPTTTTTTTTVNHTTVGNNNDEHDREQQQEQRQRPLIQATKCFAPIPFDPYVQYMSTVLQRRRYPARPFFSRISNKPRKKAMECLLHTKEEWKQEVKQMMMERVDYYRFCHNCMGSNDQIV